MGDRREAPSTSAVGDISARSYPLHAESSALVAATTANLFGYLDDHARLSSHMSQSSWRMGGGRMSIDLDEGRGQRVGSRIHLEGRIAGLRLSVGTRVTEREVPSRKAWETDAQPRLLVIGHYLMAFETTPEAAGCRLRVLIDYQLPEAGLSRLLGCLLAGWYARWCTRQMVEDARRHFSDTT